MIVAHLEAFEKDLEKQGYKIKEHKKQGMMSTTYVAERKGTKKVIPGKKFIKFPKYESDAVKEIVAYAVANEINRATQMGIGTIALPIPHQIEWEVQKGRLKILTSSYTSKIQNKFIQIQSGLNEWMAIGIVGLYDRHRGNRIVKTPADYYHFDFGIALEPDAIYVTANSLDIIVNPDVNPNKKLPKKYSKEYLEYLIFWEHFLKANEAAITKIALKKLQEIEIKLKKTLNDERRYIKSFFAGAFKTLLPPVSRAIKDITKKTV